MTGVLYNPEPPRVWSRVQKRCSSTIESSPFVYVPLQNKTISYENALYNEKQYYKGNILQYKGNSSQLTKSQKYSQIANGFGSSRKKSYASQTETYTNPNTTGLLRINYTEIPFPNTLVGKPNNISGPYQYNITNPNNCNTTSLQDGGTLICNAYADPCTGKIIKKTEQQICYPSYCSDVPGQIQDLCWDPKINTFFPRQNLTMNNSGSKWPQGYKGFVSALQLAPPILVFVYSDSSSLQLSWAINYCKMMPVTSFKLYMNNVQYKIIPNINLYTITIENIAVNSTFTITSMSGNNESHKSNIITYGQNISSSEPSTPTVTLNNDNTCKQYMDIMKDKTITQIITFLLNYLKNNQDSDNTIITLETFNQMKVDLYILKNSLKDSCFLNIIDIFKHILSIVKSGYELRRDLKISIINEQEYKNDSLILRNSEALQKYLDNLNDAFLLSKLSVSSRLAIIPKKYTLYHEKYGIPINMNYDEEKLLNIENLLRNTSI